MISLFKQDWDNLQPKLEQVSITLKIAKLIIKLNKMEKEELEQKVINQLIEELVGEDKVYPIEEALYDFDYETTEVIYKPEVFERYVEIYNSLSND